MTKSYRDATIDGPIADCMAHPLYLSRCLGYPQSIPGYLRSEVRTPRWSRHGCRSLSPSPRAPMKPAHVLAGACLCAALALILVPVRAEPQAPEQTTPKPIAPADTLAWKSLQGATLSPDGQWFSYRIAPAEGEGEMVLRRTKNAAEEKRFPSGRGGATTFSEDSKWMTFTLSP